MLFFSFRNIVKLFIIITVLISIINCPVLYAFSRKENLKIKCDIEYEINDNYQKKPNTSPLKLGDQILTINPEIGVKFGKQKFKFNISGISKVVLHKRFIKENDFNANINLGLDYVPPDKGIIYTFSNNYEKTYEGYDEGTGSSKDELNRNTFNLGVSYQTSGRFSHVLTLIVVNYDYKEKNGITNPAERIEIAQGVKFGYKIFPGTNFEIKYLLKTIRYETVDSDNEEHTLFLGTTGSITRKISGDIMFGMSRKTYNKIIKEPADSKTANIALLYTFNKRVNVSFSWVKSTDEKQSTTEYNKYSLSDKIEIVLVKQLSPKTIFNLNFTSTAEDYRPSEPERLKYEKKMDFKFGITKKLNSNYSLIINFKRMVKNSLQSESNYYNNIISVSIKSIN